MRRRLLKLASCASAAIALISAILWIQTQWNSCVAGYTAHADGASRKTFAIEAGLQRFHLSFVTGECGWHPGWSAYRKVTTDEASYEFMNAESRWQFAGFRRYVTTAPKDRWPGPSAPVARCLDIPYWFVIVLGMIPALWISAKGKAN
ncbi:MAG TPA: hypothetical protein VH370_14125 [Humisphaera sp.]|nr:hypothetical protein [Humisphaera sp.]